MVKFLILTNIFKKLGKKRKIFQKYIILANKIDSHIIYFINFIIRNIKFIFTFLIFIIVFSFFLLKYWDWINPQFINFIYLDELLKTLITASSIIVSIIIGFIVSKYFDIKQIRIKMLDKFVELQTKINEYQNAFYDLADHMARHYKIDPKYPINYHKLMRDMEFIEDEKNKPFAALFIRSIREFGYFHWDYSDYDIKNNLMDKHYILHLDESIKYVVGVLSRFKHYKYVLEDLSLPKNQNLDSIKIVNSDLIKYYALKISPENEKSNWDYFGFWHNRFEEANELIEKMINLFPFLFEYDASTIKKPMIYLIIGAFSGIIIPLLLLAIEINIILKLTLTYFVLLIFIFCFLKLISLFYSEITSKKIHYL